jgi:hypothetical protein
MMNQLKLEFVEPQLGLRKVRLRDCVQARPAKPHEEETRGQGGQGEEGEEALQVQRLRLHHRLRRQHEQAHGKDTR